VQRIGLFVDACAETVLQVLDRVELDMLQFHGAESPEYCGQFQRPYIKVLGVTAMMDMAALAKAYSDAWGIILDTHDPQLKGGTGRVFDWRLWPRNIDARLILAGGLNPDNVAEAIEQTQPFGVDVAGGVESGQKGVKDHSKMTIFIEKAKHG
jgi:phosphoribosylanthranilate isomerase